MYQIDIWDYDGNLNARYITTVLFDGKKKDIYNYLFSLGFEIVTYNFDSECEKWVNAYLE